MNLVCMDFLFQLSTSHFWNLENFRENGLSFEAMARSADGKPLFRIGEISFIPNIT